MNIFNYFIIFYARNEMKRQEFHDPNFEQKKMCVIFPMFRFVFCPLIIQHNSCSMGYFSFAFIPTFRSRKKKLVYSNEVTCEYRSHMQICQLSAVRYVSPTEYSYVLCVFLLVLLHFMCVWALFFFGFNSFEYMQMCILTSTLTSAPGGWTGGGWFQRKCHAKIALYPFFLRN